MHVFHFTFFVARQPPVGQGAFIVDASRPHTDALHSVELLWTSDHRDADLHLTAHSTQETRTDAPSGRTRYKCEHSARNIISPKKFGEKWQFWCRGTKPYYSCKLLSSVFANSVFSVFSKNVTHANTTGLLYREQTMQSEWR